MDNIQPKQSNICRSQELEELQETVRICNQIVDEFEAENKSLKNEVLQLRGKIISLNIMMDSYKAKQQIPVLVEGKEKDYYPGEQKDMILEILKEQLSSGNLGLRTKVLIESILESNKESGNREKNRIRLKNALKSYSGMDSNTLSELKAIGFELVDDTNKHLRLRFHGDNRFIFSISKTPSDPRAGKNEASKLCDSVF